ncbi:MAG: hypothetical protein M1313_09725 [Nitrospirae bacterium]|nr:hypothetical protein [Nitrospirota bacterium]
MLNRLVSGSRSLATRSGSDGKIRLDRSWAFYGVYLFSAAGFSGGVPAGGLYGAVVLGLSTVFMALLVTLLHELGHRMTARILRVPYDGSRLSFWGGFPEHRVDFGPPGPAEIAVRAAGPVVNLLLWQMSLSVLAFAGGDWAFFFPQIAYLLRIFANLNLLVALLNLFPGFPFDAGVLIGLVFSQATGKDRPGMGSLPEKLGWAGGFILSLAGLLLVARGLLISGFGGLILGYLVLNILMDFRERNRIAQILEEEGIERWLLPVPALVRPEMWVQEVILGPFLQGVEGWVPVVSSGEGRYLGELSWEILRTRSFSQWDGVRVSDLPGIVPGPVIIQDDSPSRILDLLGRRPEGLPVLREGRVSGWMKREPLARSAMIEAYLDRIPIPKSGRTDRSAIPPEFSSPAGSVPGSGKDGHGSPGPSEP